MTAGTARDPFDTLAPEFTVRVDGEPLPNDAQADLIAASVVDDVDAPGMFALTIAASSTREMKPTWIDDARFAVGRPVEIGFGYRDRTVTLISAEITGLEPAFAASRPPTLTVRGHDRRHRLMRSRRTRSFTNCKDSDIASQIAADANLKPQAEDSGVQLPYVLQHDQTDLEFLVARARRIGFEVAVRGTDLLFRRRKFDGSPELTLHREVELLEFNARLSTLGQVPALEVRGWDPAQKQEIVARAGSGDAPRAMGRGDLGPAATGKAFAPPTGARVAAPVQSQGEADAMARHGYAEMALGYVRADGVCIGEPRLRAGIVVAVEGLGTRFSGAYYVTAVEHSFSPRRGFRTSFSARRNAT